MARPDASPDHTAGQAVHRRMGRTDPGCIVALMDRMMAFRARHFDYTGPLWLIVADLLVYRLSLAQIGSANISRSPLLLVIPGPPRFDFPVKRIFKNCRFCASNREPGRESAQSGSPYWGRH